MLNLYILKTCPYCKKVTEFMDENNIEHITKDVGESEYYDELIKLGGKAQVPFLADDNTGTKLYESDDIIKYLKKIM